MNVGDECEYKSCHDIDAGGDFSWEWNTGTIVKVTGPYSARVYTVVGSGPATGELVRKTSHYIRKAKQTK